MPTINNGVVTKLDFVADHVTQIWPVRQLAGLKALNCAGSAPGKGKLVDLSALRGMALTALEINDTRVADLSPLEGLKLTTILFTPKAIAKGLDVIRQMKSLTNIGVGWGERDQFSPEEFWQKYDAGRFGRPDSPRRDGKRWGDHDIQRSRLQEMGEGSRGVAGRGTNRCCCQATASAEPRLRWE